MYKTFADAQYRYGDIRLVGGSYQWEGRVEIFISGTWGTITDSEWTNNDARVVCRKLGHFKPGIEIMGLVVTIICVYVWPRAYQTIFYICSHNYACVRLLEYTFTMCLWLCMRHCIQNHSYSRSTFVGIDCLNLTKVLSMSICFNFINQHICHTTNTNRY